MSNEVVGMGSNAVFPTLDAGPEGLTLREWGLTRRELFAAMAMQGLVAHFGTCGQIDTTETAKRAVNCADALLTALQETHDGR